MASRLMWIKKVLEVIKYKPLRTWIELILWTTAMRLFQAIKEQKVITRDLSDTTNGF